MRFTALLFINLFLTTLAAAQVTPEPEQEVKASEQSAPSPLPQKIELDSPDRDIQRRLNLLFQELAGLQQIRAEVRGGVVTLSGLALTAEDRNRAETIASRLAGVVSVENEIRIEHRVQRRLEPMIDKMDEVVRQLIASLPLLILSVIVFLSAWMLGRLLTRPNGLVGRVIPNSLVQTLIGQIVRLLFILIGLILAMRILGATAMLGSVLGAAGVLGLAIGFAVRDTIENYIASILLSIRRPFDPNDHVIIEGFEGRVTRLNSRATFLTSFDGSELRIPNAIVYKAKITNFTQIPERRFDFVIGVGYENDLCRALATALEAVKSSNGVLEEPAAQVVIDGLDASTISIKIFGWVDLRRSDFAKVRSEAIRAVKEAFDRTAISMPAPIQNIRVLKESRTKQAMTAPSVEADEISDTSADRVIEQKVDAIRDDSEDLLTADSPKE